MSNKLPELDEFRICINTFEINEFMFEKGNKYDIYFIVHTIHKPDYNVAKSAICISDNFRTIHEYRKMKIEDIL